MILAAGAAVHLALAAPAMAQDVDVTLFRSQHPSGVTIVDGVLEVDHDVLAAGEACGYGVELTVRDSTELEILENDWDGTGPCASGGVAARGDALESFNFGIRPGRYTVDIAVHPAGSPDDVHRKSMTVESLPTDVRTSDLLLANEMSWVDEDDPGGWLIRRGDLGIRTSPRIALPASAPKLSYYLELYPPDDAAFDGRATGVIRRKGGAELLEVDLEVLAGVEEDRPVAGTIPLSGLTPGEYELELRVEGDGDTVRRTRSFHVVETTRVAEAGGGEQAEFFASLSDPEVEDLFAPMVIWLETDHDRDLFQDLDPDGKRRFLTEYFGRLGPGYADGESLLDTFLERVRHVRREYGEEAGRTEQAGWRTDRGRIYIRRGAPDQRVNQPFPQEGSPPYEIWFYNIGPGYAYLFVDETNFNHYRLLFSNDPDEPTLPDWQRRAGGAAIDELFAYFGVMPGGGGSR